MIEQYLSDINKELFDYLNSLISNQNKIEKWTMFFTEEQFRQSKLSKYILYKNVSSNHGSVHSTQSRSMQIALGFYHENESEAKKYSMAFYQNILSENYEIQLDTIIVSRIIAIDLPFYAGKASNGKSLFVINYEINY
jgi:hypothetical protein